VCQLSRGGSRGCAGRPQVWGQGVTIPVPSHACITTSSDLALGTGCVHELVDPEQGLSCNMCQAMMHAILGMGHSQCHAYDHQAYLRVLNVRAACSVPVGGGTFPDAVYLLLQNLPFWSIIASITLHYAQVGCADSWRCLVNYCPS
jgi:hypothetical protein